MILITSPKGLERYIEIYDYNLANKELSFEPNKDLESLLEDTFRWYKNYLYQCKYDLVGLIPKDKGSGGGAWLGTYRLFSGLNKILGKDKVKLYVAIKNLNKNFINTIYPFGLSKFFYLKMALISKIINTLILKNKNKTHFSFNLIPTLLDLKLYLSSKKGNNIYLHWLGNNFASIWLIYVITMRKNILIKFADWWWLTGGCHYPKNCNAFERN